MHNLCFSGKVHDLRIGGYIKNVISLNEAISKSYLYAMEKINFMREVYKFVNVSKKTGVYRIFWFSPEMMTMNRSFGAEVSIDKGRPLSD